MFYMIEAEHINSTAGKRLVDELRDQYKIDVCIAGRDENFSSMFVIVISGTLAQANRVQEVAWQYNDGAFAGLRELTEDQFDEMC